MKIVVQIKYSQYENSSKYAECDFDSEIIYCPICGKEMKKRNGKYGEFYACTGFPNCEYTLPGKLVNDMFYSIQLFKRGAPVYKDFDKENISGYIDLRQRIAGLKNYKIELI